MISTYIKTDRISPAIRKTDLWRMLYCYEIDMHRNLNFFHIEMKLRWYPSGGKIFKWLACVLWRLRALSWATWAEAPFFTHCNIIGWNLQDMQNRSWEISEKNLALKYCILDELSYPERLHKSSRKVSSSVKWLAFCQNLPKSTHILCAESLNN